jgi:16S rRNA (cytosine1402-N4)-methyltransferase
VKYHEPVMLEECIRGLSVIPEGIYVDVTYGGGGHSKAILDKLGPKGKLIAFDQDIEAIENKHEDTRLILIRDNFRTMKSHLQQQNKIPVNGILADLGVSSHQFDSSARGFSIRFEHDLDMRMDSRNPLTARHILNTYPESRLVSIFSAYGEVRNSKQLAASIIKARKKSEILNSAQLHAVISGLIPKDNENQYLAKVYQALRIEVNDELGALKELLVQSGQVLLNGGRLVVMSYHSLEDRLVKNYLLHGNFEGESHKDLFGNKVGLVFKPVTKSPVTPSPEEIKRNPRSRSAKLRIAEKIQ